jgi:uncharacterized protein (TIGR02302 family)
MTSETPDKGAAETSKQTPPSPPLNLGARLFGARLALFWEQLWPALLPVVTLAGIFLALALFDILPLLPRWLHGLVLALTAGGLVWLMWRGVRRVSIAGVAGAAGIAAARRRVERDSGLAHRPLQALSDHIGAGGDDADSVALWRLHQGRMAQAARRLRVGLPMPGAGRGDPWALRALLFVVLAIGGVVGGSDTGQRLLRALNPDFSGFAMAGPGKLEIWITPPAYTGLAPLFPAQAQPADPDATGPKPLVTVKAPAGSNLTALVYGGRGGPELVLGDRRVAFEAVDGENFKIEAGLEKSGRLAVIRNGETLAEWNLEMVADMPPHIEFSAPPAPGARGALRIAFRAEDDYGLRNAAAELRRTYERGAVIGKEAFELPLNLPGPPESNVRKADEFDFHDLTPHPWAGLPVQIRLSVGDAAGHVTHGDPVKLVLPERVFNHPVARAVIEQRKRLTTEPERRRSIVQRLAMIASRPDLFGHRTVTYLALASAASRLMHEAEDTAISPVRDLLWDTALGIEDGRLSVAERDLRRAQRELMRALSKNAPNAVLERLMRQLETALNQFLSEIARRAGDPNQQEMSQTDPNTQLLRTTDIQRMLKQIRDLLRSGNTDAAREMLAQLRNLLENLRAGRQSANSAQSRAGKQMMRKFQELIRRQGDLLNRSFRQSQQPDGAIRPGDMKGDAAAQRALREMLNQLRKQLGKMGMKDGDGKEGGGKDGKGPGKAFGEAGKFMGDAAGALDRDAPGQATGPQGDALDALQRAGRGMMQQMRRRSARGSGLGMQPRFNPLQQRRDPLGRYMPTPGGIDSRDLKIPDQGSVERAQGILDELRKRAGQGFRPRIELDYIDRLLRRF